jgi:spore photoproduct lyase
VSVEVGVSGIKEILVLEDLMGSSVVSRIIANYPEARIGSVQNQLPQTILSSSIILSSAKSLPEKIKLGKQVLVLGKGSIVGRFEVSDTGVKCPSFERLNPCYNCPFHCSWCFLVGTFRGLRPFLYLKVNYEDHLREIDEHTSSGKHFFVYGELQDGTAFEPASGFLKMLIPHLAQKDNVKLLILTKAASIDGLSGLKHGGNTIFSCTLQASPYDMMFEKGAPSTEYRLAKMKVMGEHGYPLRVRINPIVFLPGWVKHYSDLVAKIFATIEPERITLGVPRFEAPTKTLVKKVLLQTDPDNPLLWQLDLLEYQHPEAVTDGKRSRGKFSYPEDVRVGIYSFIIEEIRERSSIPIALCKETKPVWEAVGLDLSKVQCNCVWESVDLSL